MRCHLTPWSNTLNILKEGIQCRYLASLPGGDVVPVAVQGVCTCTVYAGDNAEFVVQFRIASPN
jgi:hypothetical protein